MKASTGNMADILLQHARKSASLVMLVIDEAGCVAEANASARRYFGDGIEGDEAHTAFVNFGEPLDVMELARSQEGPVMLSVNNVNGLPGTLYFHFYDLPEGQVLALGEIDYTESERLRTSLATVNADLGNLARDLQRKNVQLERLDNLKNEFLGMAAHDLRSPIGAIRSYCDILIRRQNILPEQQAQFVHTIQSLSEFMLRMLNDLLDITAIESGKIKINAEPLELSAALREVVDIYKIIADKKGITVEFEPSEDEVWVQGDAFKMRQVFENLLSNALKFSHEATRVRIDVRAQAGKARISVTDEGMGIPTEDLPSLFKPFAKMQNKPTGDEKSTGLGLAIVRKIVTAHDGEISAKSEPGKGSTFSVEIPLMRKEPTE